jgi:chemotaxis protein CheX
MSRKQLNQRMPVITPSSRISDELIQQAIAKGVTDVFGTMTRETIDSLGRTPNPPLHSRPLGIEGPHVVASVGFIGDLNGIINTHFDDEVALALSAKMLDMTPAEVIANSVLADSMGELANMIVGVFKNALCDMGYICKLTLPSIIRGNDFHIDHALKSGVRYIFNFRCRGRGIVTDIILQPE